MRTGNLGKKKTSCQKASLCQSGGFFNADARRILRGPRRPSGHVDSAAADVSGPADRWVGGFRASERVWASRDLGKGLGRWCSHRSRSEIKHHSFRGVLVKWDEGGWPVRLEFQNFPLKKSL